MPAPPIDLEGPPMLPGLGGLALTVLAAALGSPEGADPAAEAEAWRQRREATLRAEDGWLTLVGLHWLRDGQAVLGSGPAADVLLPASAPERLGTLTLAGGLASFKAEPGVAATVAGKPFAEGPLRTDADGPADVLAAGDLRLTVIKRGERFALRVKDNRSPIRLNFAGLSWFAYDPAWRVEARFVARPSDARIVFDTVVGGQDVLESAGYAVFEKDGQEYRLEAAREGDHLWFVFRDATSGRTTHPNARQLTTDGPDADGTVVLDFNRAINLPCAFTNFATCPLAPRQNRLPLAITAGERKYEPRPSAGAANPG